MGWLAPLLALAFSVVAGCAPDTPPQAQPSRSPGPECGPPQVARAPECQALTDTARRVGEVSVVVTLTTPFTPEGQLDAERRRQQRRAIDAAQDDLLDQLAPHRIRVLARYDATPQLALLVDPGGLRVLLTSDLVAHVQHNTPQPPG